jgi:hypothetical protein
MVTLLITSFFILAFLAVAVYFWQKPASTTETESLLPPSEWRGLFSDGIPDQSPEVDDSETTAIHLQKRAELLQRAKSGDKSVLQEARNLINLQDASVYDEVLNSLVELADSDPKLLSLVSHVQRYELPVNKKLAEKFVNSCKSAPGQSSATKMLHVAALSDDAELYQAAVGNALDFWRNDHLSEISPHELLAILEGEFWILSAQVRSSGAGFLLKRTLSSARRELEAAHINQNQTTTS